MSLAQQAGFMDIVGLSCFSGSCSVVGEFKSWEWKWEVQWQQDKVWWYSECRGGNFAAAVAIVVVAIPESLLLWVTSRRGWWALPWRHHHFYWQMGQPFVEPRWKWFGIINIERGQLRQAFCNWICYNHNSKCSNNDSPQNIHYIISLCLAAIELLIPILIFWKRQTNDTTRTTKATGRPALSRMKLGCWARLVYVSVLYIFTEDCLWMSSPQASDMNINWPSQKQGQILPSISLPVSDKIKLDIVVGLIRS